MERKEGRTPVGRKPAGRPRYVSPYYDTIREDLARLGYIGMDPRAVEAYMRVEHSTLDHLDATRFRAEVRIAAQCVELAGPEESEQAALSYGL